jgi:hypothetical protein
MVGLSFGTCTAQRCGDVDSTDLPPLPRHGQADSGGLLRLDDSLLEDAATLGDDGLRSLDASHLAAARVLGDGLAEVVTYDRRMADAAESLGLRTLAPA